MFKNLSISGKLVLLFLLFGLIPLGICGFIAFQTTREVDAATAKRLRIVASALADKIDRNLFERYGDVQAFTLNRSIDNRDNWYKIGETENTVVDVMNQYVDTYDLYYLTVLVDLDGKVVAVNSRDQDGNALDSDFVYEMNFKGSEWFKAVSNRSFTSKLAHTSEGNDVSTGTFVTDVHIDELVRRAYPGDDGLAMAFSSPVTRKGEVIGYWSNIAKFAVVEDIFRAEYKSLKKQGYESAELTLLDPHGTVLIDYEPARTGSEEVNHDVNNVVLKLNLVDKGIDAVRNAVAGDEGYGFAEHARKGIRQGVGYAHLVGALGYPGMGWSVLVRVPEEFVVAEGTAEARWLVLVTAAVSCAAIVLLGLWIGRRFARPIVELSTVAERIAGGDLDGEIRHNSGDETGQLANAFRRVSDTMRQLNDTMAGLVHSTQEGKLDERADESRFSGCYRELVGGMNASLKAMAEPTTEAANILEKVADGDLSVRMTGVYQGDFAALSDSLNKAVENLDEALSQVASTGSHVASASDQVQLGSQRIAEGTTEQASALEEIASSLEEMTSMTRHSADNANQAKHLADETRQQAEHGNVAMIEMGKAIDKIKQSADEQAKIVKTIDEIAFQTNLLALNAAVEAARAGDAGKGFAVVAEEVRNLAQRSAEAARTTSAMISESVEKSEHGVSITNQVADALNQIQSSAHKTNDLIAEIAAAANEQAQGIGQVNTAVTQLDSATQQAADTSQESATIASELNQQVDQLAEMVARFRLTNSVSHRRPAGSQSNGETQTGSKKTNQNRLAQSGSNRGNAPAASAAQPVRKKAMSLVPFDEDEDFKDF